MWLLEAETVARRLQRRAGLSWAALVAEAVGSVLHAEQSLAVYLTVAASPAAAVVAVQPVRHAAV